MRFALLQCFILVFAGVSVANAQSLEVRQTQQYEETSLQEDAFDIPQNCGADITISINWATFTDEDYNHHQAIFMYCREAVSALRMICQQDLGREAVQNRLSALVCERGDTRSAVIEDDGTYRYTYTWEDTASVSWHQEFLGNNL